MRSQKNQQCRSVNVILRDPNCPFQPLWQNKALWTRTRQVYGMKKDRKGRLKLDLTKQSDKTEEFKELLLKSEKTNTTRTLLVFDAELPWKWYIDSQANLAEHLESQVCICYTTPRLSAPVLSQ